MYDVSDIRDCYVALGQLVARAPVTGFGNSAAEFLMTVAGATRVQYWELSAGADALVLLGDAKQGASLNKADTHRFVLRKDGRSLCPFDLAALSGQAISITSASGYDLTRLRSVFGPYIADRLEIVPFKAANGALFGCAVFAGHEPETLQGTEFRIAVQSVVRLGERDRENKRLLRTNAELSAALRRYDSEKREQKKTLDHDLTKALPGRSAKMRSLRTRVQHLARTNGPVLIATPTGDSAEPLARQLHSLGRFASDPFLVLPASMLADDRLAIELFGHKRGIVPGVSAARRGSLREAGRGTVLIDRIEDLDLAGQEQILRLVRTGHFRPFGSTRDLPLQARLVFSVRQENLAEGAKTPLPPELYYELKPGELIQPSLSGAPEDALDLLQVELERAGFDADEISQCLGDKGLSRALTRRAQDNSRDGLSALIRSAMHEATTAGVLLEAEHVQRAEASPATPVKATGKTGALPDQVAEFEAGVIADALDRFNGRRSDAARWLAIPKRTLADKCQRYGL